MAVTRSGAPPPQVSLQDAPAAPPEHLGIRVALGPPLTVVGAPAAPSGLTAAAGDRSILLRWSDPGNDRITGYEVRVQADGTDGAEWQPIAGSGAGTVAHRLTALTNGTVYDVQIRAGGAAGPGPASATVSSSPRPGICERTPAVRDAIVAETVGITDCAQVRGVHLGAVVTLDLSERGIESLQLGDFAGLTGVTELRMESNRLAALPADLFSGLGALVTLSLRDNELTTLPDGLFTDLGALTHLRLDGNALGRVEAATFDPLTALRSLDLSGNRLTALPRGLFRGPSGLVTLDLHGNLLTSLPEGAFAELAALDELRLDGNRLNALPDGAFVGLAALDELRLDSNRLSALPEGAFAGLAALRELRLDGNRLSVLPAGAFAGLAALRELRLDSNRLSALPEGVFAGVGALTDLRLDNNRGAPFTLPVVLEQIGARTFRGRMPSGAPFAVRVGVEIADGIPVKAAAEVPAGGVESAPIAVTPRVAGTAPVVTTSVAPVL
ncbi:MAG: leucine-rich repeat protein, partial [Spirochaetaceae bacterium]|nr:leucine-rich repeat protein [Spirochaetaceae bacterium]